MPFGVCNAPATFQRLVNKVLGDVLQCKAYLDDLIGYSDDWVSDMTTLYDVFARLAGSSLMLNFPKCVWEGLCLVSWSTGWPRPDAPCGCKSQNNYQVSCPNHQTGIAPVPWDGWAAGSVETYLLWRVSTGV